MMNMMNKMHVVPLVEVVVVWFTLIISQYRPYQVLSFCVCVFFFVLLIAS